jgi:uncharacterized membrane-anchored protein
VTSSIIVLGIINYAIFEKEHLKSAGRTVLLELAPVDPRSLMQGDYMRLRYAIERQVPYENSVAKKGYLVVTVDEKEIAHFKRFYQDEVLAKDEALLRYRQVGHSIEIIPHSFFFQEGHADYYQAAKYGEFKLDAKGRSLLVALRDNQLLRIDPEKKIP